MSYYNENGALVGLKVNSRSARKRIVLCVLLFFLSFVLKAQQINVVSEISWYAYGVTYNGLMVTFTDDTGVFVVDFYSNSVGFVRVVQSVNVRNNYDAWGNCTTYLYGYDAMPSKPIPYSPDSFVIFPNGTMYTQDASGIWSTAIVARVVPQYQWNNVFHKYGLDD